MGFRFHRSFKLLPGIRINLSKTGPSISLGTKGATVNFGSKGTRTTLGLPGTGMSYTRYSSSKTASDNTETPAGQGASNRTATILRLLAIAFFVLLMVLLSRL